MPRNSVAILLVEVNPDDVIIKDMMAELQTDALHPLGIQLTHRSTLREFHLRPGYVGHETAIHRIGPGGQGLVPMPT